MPHSVQEPTTKMAPQVNGDAPSSAFLHHLFSYPVISDSVDTFKSNPYGAKSIDFTTHTYEKLGKPFLPYLAKPYQYVSPYVARADSLGDSTLSTLDSRFPVVKKPTGELIDDGKALVFFPLKKGHEGKDYVLGVWGGEKKKVGGEGIVTYGKAALATSLVVGTDAYTYLATFFSKKGTEAKEATTEKLNN